MSAIEAVKMSFCRCTLKPGFIDRFYAHFLKSHPSVAPRFKDTDMEAQRAVLRHGLAMMIQYPQGSSVARNALDRIAVSHGARNLNIPAHLYTYWLESLVAAVRDFDPQFSPALEKHWRAVMQEGIDHIVAGGEGA
jgi:hemoglobin-like flavoprotein